MAHRVLVERGRPGDRRTAVGLALSWMAVGLPLLWGVAQTIKKTLALFS